MRLPSPIHFMWLVFAGFGASAAYGIAGAALIYAMQGTADAEEFLKLYIGPFNMLVTLGLGVATALIIGKSQHLIPSTIEASFTSAELSRTAYFENKRRNFSFSRTVVFTSQMIILGGMVFHFCHFPLSGVAAAVMLTVVGLQIGLASYVGRKIRYAGMMLHSLLDIEVTENLFKKRKLDVINTYVQSVSILALVGVYIGVRSYYGAPFLYVSFIERSAQVLLLLPIIIATPVLLMFNFYPREVLQKIYDKSIDIELDRLRNELQDESLSEFEKELRLMEFEKMYREELRYSLQLQLSDLPIGIAIVVMVLEPLISG